MQQKSVSYKTLIVESDHFNFDYSHFLPWHEGKCCELHGHSSKITVAVRGLCTELGMVVDFALVKTLVKKAIDLVDHKLFVRNDYIDAEAVGEDGYIWVKFDSKNGHHEFRLPRNQVVILDRDSTVENLSEIMAASILCEMPENVIEVAVQMNEGIGKSCISPVIRASRNGLKLKYVVVYGCLHLFDLMAFPTKKSVSTRRTKV